MLLHKPAKKGERVTCANNHPICTIARDFVDGETLSPDQFTDWSWDYKPHNRTAAPDCPICGADWIRSHNGQVIQIHIGDEWRTSEHFKDYEILDTKAQPT